jgi:hypothetical protein
MSINNIDPKRKKRQESDTKYIKSLQGYGHKARKETIFLLKKVVNYTLNKQNKPKLRHTQERNKKPKSSKNVRRSKKERVQALSRHGHRGFGRAKTNQHVPRCRQELPAVDQLREGE